MTDTNELYQKLVLLREKLKIKEKASTGRTPVICSDEALLEIAKYHPRVLRDFEGIHGIGKTFIDKYGQNFLDEVTKLDDKDVSAPMTAEITKTLKELEKNLITLNKRNRLLYSGSLRVKDGCDLSEENTSEILDLLFGRKNKIIIKNDELPGQKNSAQTNQALQALNLTAEQPGFETAKRTNALSTYKKIVQLLRETNKDLRDKGQNNLYIAYPFVMGKLLKGDFDVRAPLFFFPVKAEKTSTQIVLTRDSSRDGIFNNALILANDKFNNVRKPLPNPEPEDNFKSEQDVIEGCINFYKENGLIIQQPDIEKIIKYFNYTQKDFPKYEKGELTVVRNIVIGKYQICDSTIQKDYDELLEKKMSTKQINELLSSFSTVNESSDFGEKDSRQNEEQLSNNISEKNLLYINSLNSSQEQVIDAINKMDQLVIQGPPGTGKSQTITSLISDFVLKDKTVLMVSEKKTAIDVVYSRLGNLSRYALLIDDVGNKEDFYAQVSAMLSSAADASKRANEIGTVSEKIDNDVNALNIIADKLYMPNKLGVEPFVLYENSHKIDTKNQNAVKALLKLQNNSNPKLFELTYDELQNARNSFLDDELCSKLAFYIKTNENSPWINYFKNDLTEYQSAELNVFLEEKKLALEEALKLSFFKKLSAKGKIKKELKNTLKNYADKNPGKIIKSFFKEPQKTIEIANQLPLYLESKELYGGKNEKEILYFKSLILLQETLENLSWSQADNELFNFILNIHISKFEAENKDAVLKIKSFDNIVKGIDSQRDKKTKDTIKNTEIKLSQYMLNLTKSKRQNEIKRALETSRKMSVSRFITKYKLELFDSIKIWMMTPEVVSELIPLQHGIFDIVIFDEASQMFVEKGIPSIYRANKVVIAGDTKQLRPTKLFTGRFEENPDELAEDEETNEALEEPSLLDLAKYKYKDVMLQYHYRSKYEELIAFSNHAFYEGKLLVSPNVATPETSPIEVHKIEDGMWINTANRKEAEYCVKLIKQIFAERKKNETIGVITFNSHQHDMIEDCIDEECAVDKNFELAIANERIRKEDGEDKSLFVKNIENVQGDERDIIIFSVGFAKNEQGKIFRNFGWLNNEGGENRLNVAISRAKKKIHIVTSIQPSELDVTGLKNQGPAYLKKYLEYCFAVSDGNVELTRTILDNLCENVHLSDFYGNDTPFEEEVFAKLKERGLDVYANVGIGGYCIDFAIKKDNAYVLGIECDFNLYKDSTSTRERDYHRQKYLESRGWKVYRLWSSEWWKNQDAELDKIVKLCEV